MFKLPCPGVLDSLAKKFSCDKSSVGNQYTELYHLYLKDLRYNRLRLLEVGVAEKAASLRMWSEYLPNAEIFGIDITSSCFADDIERTSIHIGDITDHTFLDSFLKDHSGDFDIIIDDASHSHPATIHTLENLWPSLSPGGMYVIEDLHCCYFPSFHMTKGCAQSTMTSLKELTDTLNVDVYKRTKTSERYENPQFQIKFSEEDLTQFEETLFGVHFYKSICFLFKKPRG